MTLDTKRSYHRRSDDERIAELQTRIEELKKKMETRQRPDMAVVREIPRLQKKLRRFAQIAADNGRDDIANSTMAFIAGLERMVSNVDNAPRRRSRSDDGEYDDAQGLAAR